MFDLLFKILYAENIMTAPKKSISDQQASQTKPKTPEQARLEVVAEQKARMEKQRAERNAPYFRAAFWLSGLACIFAVAFKLGISEVNQYLAHGTVVGEKASETTLKYINARLHLFSVVGNLAAFLGFLLGVLNKERLSPYYAWGIGLVYFMTTIMVDASSFLKNDASVLNGKTGFVYFSPELVLSLDKLTIIFRLLGIGLLVWLCSVVIFKLLWAGIKKVRTFIKRKKELSN